MADDLSAAYRQASVTRRLKAGAMALASAGCGIVVVYWASASPTLGFVLALFALTATVVLTLGVYVLCEPIGESLEEYAELTMQYRDRQHQESRSA